MALHDGRDVCADGGMYCVARDNEGFYGLAAGDPSGGAAAGEGGIKQMSAHASQRNERNYKKTAKTEKEMHETTCLYGFYSAEI